MQFGVVRTIPLGPNSALSLLSPRALRPLPPLIHINLPYLLVTFNPVPLDLENEGRKFL
jgi:hypothetical protein